MAVTSVPNHTCAMVEIFCARTYARNDCKNHTFAYTYNEQKLLYTLVRLLIQKHYCKRYCVCMYILNEHAKVLFQKINIIYATHQVLAQYLAYTTVRL